MVAKLSNAMVCGIGLLVARSKMGKFAANEDLIKSVAIIRFGPCSMVTMMKVIQDLNKEHLI